MRKFLLLLVVLSLVSASAARRKNELKLLTWDPPRYPFVAAAANAQGLVNLRLTVGQDGHVQSVEVLSGNHLLTDSAVEAGKKLIFDCSACQPGQTVLRKMTFKYQIKGKPDEERKIKVKKLGEGMIEVTVNPPLPGEKR
jgi:TonB family protein